MMQLRPESGNWPRRSQANVRYCLVSAGLYGEPVTAFRICEAADLLGVGADTVRRWVDAGRLPASRDEHGRRRIAGPDLAAFARSLGGDPDQESDQSSARNRLRGIVTPWLRTR
jgi:excisionase family DNA binding protein